MHEKGLHSRPINFPRAFSQINRGKDTTFLSYTFFDSNNPISHECNCATVMSTLIDAACMLMKAHSQGYFYNGKYPFVNKLIALYIITFSKH